MYYVAFSQPNNEFHILWELMVEIQFGTDLVLNFITEYREENSEEPVREF